MVLSLNWDREFALKQVGNDEELLKECMSFFLEATFHDLSQLTSATKEGNFDNVKRAAHSLKGAAMNIGMRSIMELAIEIEEAAKDKDLETIENKLETLKKLVQMVKEMDP